MPASAAERLSWSYENQTCPAINKLVEECKQEISRLNLHPRVASQLQQMVEDLSDDFKSLGTIPLRNALISCCGDLLSARGEDRV